MSLTLINLSSKPNLCKIIKKEIDRYRLVNKLEEPVELKNNQGVIALEELEYIEKISFDKISETIPFLKIDNKRISLINYLTSLRMLTIKNCPYMCNINLNDIANKDKLEDLEISDSQIQSIDLTEFPNLKSLSITNCNSLKEIKGLNNLKQLESIELYNIPYVTEYNICQFISKNIKNKQIDLTLDTLYYPKISEMIRNNFGSSIDTFFDIMWIESIHSGVSTKQTYNTRTLGGMYADISEIIKDIGIESTTPPIEKIYRIYNWICNNVTYDDDGLENTLRMHSRESILNFENVPQKIRFLVGQTGGTNGSFNALRMGTSVCQGYTKLFQMFLKKVGINSYDVAACLSDDKNPTPLTYRELTDTSKINHSIIKIELPEGKKNNYYYCDATNDTVYTEHYHIQSTRCFLKTIEELNTSWYPICDTLSPNSTKISEEELSKLKAIKVERKVMSEKKVQILAEKIMLDYDLYLESESLEDIIKEYQTKCEIVDKLMLLGVMNRSVAEKIRYQLGIQTNKLKRQLSTKKQ